MCDKIVNTHSSAMQFVPECIMTQQMCDKAFNKSFLALFYVPDQYKTQEICNSIISDDPFSVRYVPDQYKTRKMRDKTFDDCLAALKLVPDWSVTSKMIKKPFTAFYTDENILYFNEDSVNVVFICNEMCILNINFNNTNPDDTNYDEEDPDTIIHIRLLAWHIRFEKHKDALVVYNVGVLKHFVEDCVNSIQYKGIVAFCRRVLENIWLKIVHKNFHV